MKIGILTGESIRHNALASYLTHMGHEVIQFSETTSNPLEEDLSIKNYFDTVKEKEFQIFSEKKWNLNLENKVYLKKGDINLLPKLLDPLFTCERIIVFGASFIKDELYKKLCDIKTVNLHIGISPQYTGSGCNFWAMYDNNLEYVGGTIQTLSEKLDEGKILKYCYPEIDYTNFDPLMFSMNAVKATFEEVEDVLINYDDFIVNAKNNEADKLIRHSKIKDFNAEVIKSFYTQTFDLNEIELLRQ